MKAPRATKAFQVVVRCFFDSFGGVHGVVSGWCCWSPGDLADSGVSGVGDQIRGFGFQRFRALRFGALGVWEFWVFRGLGA